MTKSQVIERLAHERLVPVIRADSPASALRMVEALLAGGISVFEITMTVPNAVEVIAEVAQEFGERVLLGAGTVLDAHTARACIDAGAQFVVSPGFDGGTVTLCNGLGVCVAPGALTPTEILAAWRHGADIVKVFPCDAVGGPSYIKSIKAPLPQIPLMPTGGVTLENWTQFLAAGAIAVGVGSNLVDPKLTGAQLAERARAFVEKAKAESEPPRPSAN